MDVGIGVLLYVLVLLNAGEACWARDAAEAWHTSLPSLSSLVSEQDVAAVFKGLRVPHPEEEAPQCTCSDRGLCKRVRTQYEKEFFGFMWPPTKNFRLYDWTHLTAVAWQEDPELVCLAHSHGARVIMNSGEVGPPLMGNHTAGIEWVTDTVQHILDHALDGINFDFEKPLSRRQLPQPSQLERGGVSQRGTHAGAVRRQLVGGSSGGSSGAAAAVSQLRHVQAQQQQQQQLQAARHVEGSVTQQGESVTTQVKDVTARAESVTVERAGVTAQGAGVTAQGEGVSAEDYTFLVACTSAVLRVVAPGAQVSTDFAWSPFDIDRRNYDWAGLAAASDLVFIMAYDMQSQVWGRCVAAANDPLPSVVHALEQWSHLVGIPPNKMVLGLPWYGYDYPCVPDRTGRPVAPDQDVCLLPVVEFEGAPCSDAAGVQRPYAEIMQMVRQGLNTTPITTDTMSVSRTFNYRSTDDGSVHQVWFDDGSTLLPRYKLADSMGLRGVGCWNLEWLYAPTPDTATPDEIREMWEAVHTGFFSNGRSN